MPIGLAIFLTLFAATLARVGTVLLKQATVATTSKPDGLRRLFSGLARSKRALLGVAFQVLGIVLYAAAVESPSAPISVLQPLRAFGIVIMAFLAVVFLHERLCALEWTGVAVLLAGAIMLSVSVASGAHHHAEVIRWPYWLGSLSILGLLAMASGGLLMVRGGQGAFLSSGPSAKRQAEVLYGLLAGIFLGVGYLDAKVFFVVWQSESPLLAIPSALAMVAGLVGGLAVLLASFREGRVLIVTTVNLVVNQIIVIVGGYFCLEEVFPQRPFFFYARLFGLAATLVGIIMLARFQGSAPLRSRLARGRTP